MHSVIQWEIGPCSNETSNKEIKEDIVIFELGVLKNQSRVG
jgi:hypothetical protein